MSFIDQTQFKQYDQLSKGVDGYYGEPSWMEGFAASIGSAFDEGLTISPLFNNAGTDERHDKVKELGIDLSPYIAPDNYVDWEAVQVDYPDIKTDAQIDEERAEYLAIKRGYAERVMHEAPLSSVIAGGLVGYSLDPVAVLTMPLAIPVKAAQGLSILSRSAYTARNFAAIGAGTEAAIQPFIYKHKAAIDSPYSASDAITSIAAAAVGAGAIGGVTGGISGYLRSVLKSVDESKLDDVELKAYSDVQDMADGLEGVPVSKQESHLVEVNEQLEMFNTPNKAEPYEYKQAEAMPRGHVENDVLAEHDVLDGMNEATIAYNKLETRVINQDGVMTDADEVIKQLDSDINGLENVMRCFRG